MLNLRKFFISVALICSATIFAQNAPNITVTVKDSATAEPIGYATVELLNAADSSLISGITNDNGFIAIPARPGTAKIHISFVGYKDYKAPITALDLGVVLLAEDATLLSEVSVTGSNRTVKIDRDIYVITKDLKAGAVTSRELLGKLNGVVYNPYDQSLMVNGDKNVLILIDGIEKDQNMAKTLSPDRIDRVEVIKNPVGKYAADGYKAVINLITKKDFSGFDININPNPMFNFISPKGNNVFIQEASNLNFLYTYKKLNLYATYFNWHTNLKIPMISEKRYGDLTVKTPSMETAYKNPNMNNLGNMNNVTLGGDYTIKDGHNIALEMNLNTSNNYNSIISDLTTFKDGIPIGENHSKSTSKSNLLSEQATLTYHGKLSEKSNFEADLRYRHSTPENFSTFEQGGMPKAETKNNQVENFYRINAQYTYQFTPKFSMDLGYGAMIDNYNLYQAGATLTQHQVRNRPSAYFSYTFSDKLNMKAGAMVEFFNQTYTYPDSILNLKYKTLKQSQTGFLPFVNVMYRPSDKFSVTAKYRAYPSYPEISQLNTFTTQTDSLTFSVGNPDLKPSNYQEVGLDINFLHIFNVSPFFSFDAGNFKQYLWENGGKFYESTVNTKYRSYGVNVSFTLPITKTFFWQNWFQIRNENLSYKDASNNRTTFMCNSMLIYSITKWDAMVVAGIQKNIAKWATLQGYQQQGNDIPMIMLQKNFWQKRLSVALVYVPPVFNSGFIQSTQGSLTEIPNVYYAKQDAGLKLLNNLMIFQINFHFNQGKQVNVKKSSLDNDSNAKQKSGGIGL